MGAGRAGDRPTYLRHRVAARIGCRESEGADREDRRDSRRDGIGLRYTNSTMNRAVIAEPSEFHTRRTLVESLGISVADFKCRIHDARESPEEPNTTHSIVFIRRGLFRRKYRGETLLVDPNYILFFNSGEPYQY